MPQPFAKPYVRRPTAVLLLVGCVQLIVATAARGQVVVEPFEVQTPAGTARGLIATVDLADPRVEPVVSDVRDGKGGYPKLATDEWAEQNNIDLAINANFFGATAPVGLAVSDGKVVSPARGTDPVLLIYPGRAAVVSGVEPKLDGVIDAIAGVGPSEQEPNKGGPLVKDGQNVGHDSRVAADQRHPRTAVGVDVTGRKLFLVVVDGRQKDWSVGLTLPELAEVMIARGVDDAINLDGGGSTALVWHGPQGHVRNRPSDGQDRPVPVHLGFRVNADAAGAAPSTQPG